MDFLVQISVALPTELSGEELDALRAEELRRGRELRDAGSIRLIWRVPGGLRNVGVWTAADATELQGLLESLPMYRWLTAEVTALAVHPIDRDDE